MFAFKFSLQQDVVVRPPNDKAKVIKHVDNFPFVYRGDKPKHVAPGLEYPALWRGRDAGGSDAGEWKIETKGQLPTDDVLRPSSLPQLVAPKNSLTTELSRQFTYHTLWLPKSTFQFGVRLQRV